MPRTKKTNTPTDQPTEPTPHPETVADVSAIRAENERLKAQTAAQAVQSDQMLDMLVEMRDKLAALEAGVVAAPEGARAISADAKQAELDAELAELTEEFADYPAIDVFERRALVGAEANAEIRLTDEPSVLEDPDGEHRKWKLRWFNLSKEGRATQADGEGYIKVQWSELRSGESLGIVDERKDEYVRRGDKGHEVLYKIPLKLYAYKKRRDAERMSGMLTSESRLRDHLANGVAGRAGSVGDNADQAGSFVHGKDFSLQITKGATERVTA